MIWFAWWTAQHIGMIFKGIWECGFTYVSIMLWALKMVLLLELYSAIHNPTPGNIVTFLLNWGFYAIWALFLLTVCYMAVSKIIKKVIE